MTYPNTFYAAEVDAGESLAPLSKHLQADVCIIGGDLAELTTGLELARRGLGVVLLKAERVGWGASGRNGGCDPKNGSVSAAHVVFCTSAYDLSIYRPMTKAVPPVSTYVVATDPEVELLSVAIKTRASITDTRRAGDYYRRLPDGRILWGGRISTRTEVPRHMGDLLLKDTYSVYKQLGSLKPAYVWLGIMWGTRST